MTIYPTSTENTNEIINNKTSYVRKVCDFHFKGANNGISTIQHTQSGEINSSISNNINYI